MNMFSMAFRIRAGNNRLVIETDERHGDLRDPRAPA